MEVEYLLRDVYAKATQHHSKFTLFDGDAHKGYHTNRMAYIPVCERVIAVEADPIMARDLRKKINEMRGACKTI